MAPLDLLAAAKLNEPRGAPKLPPLRDVRSHQLYRTREAEELEEATWHVEGADGHPPSLADPVPVRLCSRSSGTDAVITFQNKSGVAMRALWIDFKGNEVCYSEFEPNTTKRYRTYVTHPWIVREVTTGMRMMLGQRQVVVGAAQETTVDITLPPRIHWEAATHTCFPDAFKTSTRALLLAHKRLENAAAAAMHSSSHSSAADSNSSASVAKQSAFDRALAAEPYGVMDADADAAVDAHMLDQQQGRQAGVADTAGVAGAAGAAAGMRLKRALSESELTSVGPPAKVMSPVKAASPAVAWTQGHPAPLGAAQRPATGHVTGHVSVGARSPVQGRAGSKGVAFAGSAAVGVAGGGVKSFKKSPKKSSKNSTVFRSLMGALRHGLMPSNNSSASSSSCLIPGLTASPTKSPLASPAKTHKTLNHTAQTSGLSSSGLAHQPESAVKQQGAPQQGDVQTGRAALAPVKRVLVMGGGVAGVKDQQLPAGCHLGMLPHHLIVHIIELLAQQEVVLQHINREAPIGRAAILPALLPGPPPEATPAADMAAAGADAAAADAAGDAAGEEGEGLPEPLGAAQQGQQGQQQQEEGDAAAAGAGGLVGLQEPMLAAAAHFLQHAWHGAHHGAGADFAMADADDGDDGPSDDGEEGAGQLPLGWAPLELGAAAVAGGVDFAEMLMDMLVLDGQAGEAQDE